MIDAKKLFTSDLRIVNLGLEVFHDALDDQEITNCQVEWKPPAGGDIRMIRLLDSLNQEKIDRANQTAFERILAAEPELVDVCYAHEVLSGLDEFTIGHAGPPLTWDEMCGPMKGAVMGAAVYEGMCERLEDVEPMVRAGKIKFRHNHEMGCVGPMTGMITRSMPLWVVRNVTFGNVAYSTFNEGLGKVMRFGANGPEVIARLRWLEKTLAPAMKSALALSGPISLKVLISKALTMGDEMHQRNIAASCLFIRTMAPWLVRSVYNAKALAEVMDFISGNDQFFLNLAMAAGKSTMDPVKNIPYSTIVTAMSRNGTNFGVKISALGDRWFQAPVLMPKGLYFPGYSEKDANPDMGDSAICETFGIGGVAMASAPAVVRFVGAKSVAEAMRYSRQMQQIAVGLNNAYIMPTMNFVGTATGLDAKKIVETGILPVINTGMAHKKAGVGQVGAGIVFAPPDCFAKAMEAFAAEYGAWR